MLQLQDLNNALEEIEPRDDQGHREERSPLLFVGIEPEENKTIIHGDDRPAGTGGLSARLAGRMPCTINECPANERRNNFPEKKKGHDGKDGVEYPVKQVMCYPADDANLGDRGSHLFCLNSLFHIISLQGRLSYYTSS